MSRKLAMSGILGGLGAGMILLSLVAGFVPQREGPEVRRKVVMTVAQLRPDEIPRPIVRLAHGGWSIRAAAVSADAALVLSSQDAEESVPRREDWIAFTDEGVGLTTSAGFRSVEMDLSAAFMPLLPLNEPLSPVALAAIAPADYGESLTVEGRPLRWLVAQSPALRRQDPECGVEQTGVSAQRALDMLARYPFNARDSFTRARRYKSLVAHAARRFGLSEALVYAIIQTESNFSPVLVSSRSATGLMQLLPSTAGGEVHAYLYGRPSRVTYDDLANPELNIRYGTAYLHLLLTRHLAQIRNPQSREYCALAAYNMGPNRFLRMFSSDRDTAIEMINALPPAALYQRLTTEFPVRETRAFVAKVTHRRGAFESFQ